MKRILFSLSLLMTISFANAQTANDEITKEIERAIELSQATSTFSNSMNSMMQPLVAQGMISTDQLSGLITELEQLMVPALKEKISVLYRENFTLDELKQMNAYLASPLGQKAVKLTPMITSESMKLATSPDFQSKMQEIIMRNLQK